MIDAFCEGALSSGNKVDVVDVSRKKINGCVACYMDGNWFTILFGVEKSSDSYGYQVNIGKIDCELSKISSLKGSYTVIVELAE